MHNLDCHPPLWRICFGWSETTQGPLSHRLLEHCLQTRLRNCLQRKRLLLQNQLLQARLKFATKLFATKLLRHCSQKTRGFWLQWQEIERNTVPTCGCSIMLWGSLAASGTELNPLEIMWAVLKIQVHAGKYTNLFKCYQFCQEEWSTRYSGSSMLMASTWVCTRWYLLRNI